MIGKSRAFSTVFTMERYKRAWNYASLREGGCTRFVFRGIMFQGLCSFNFSFSLKGVFIKGTVFCVETELTAVEL